jgi:hypothetical protein
VTAHAAVIQATLEVIDVAQPPAAPSARTAQLWDLGAAIPSQQQSADVVANGIALAGPLPATYGVSVTTTGEPDVVGPDFRSPSMAGGAPPTRVEVVLGPLVKLTPDDVQGWLAGLLPYVTSIAGSGGVSAELTVSSGGVSFAPGQIAVTISGVATPHGPIAAIPPTPFAASLTLGLVPAGAPAVADPLELATIVDASIDAPGLVGALAGLLLPFMRSFVNAWVLAQLRAAFAANIPPAIERAFALAGLPASVTVSLRRLSIDTDGVSFQPALGAFGDTLSTFAPPAIPNP